MPQLSKHQWRTTRLFAAITVLLLLSGCSTLSSWYSTFTGDGLERGSADTESWRRFAGTIKPVSPDTVHYRMGRYFQKKKKYMVAIDEYKKVLRNHPGHVDALNAMGVACDQLGWYATAEMSYKAALDLDAGRADVLNNLGYSYLMQNKIQAAIETFHKAVNKDGTNKTYTNNLGLAYARDRQYSRAFVQFRKSNQREQAFQKLLRIVAKFGQSEQEARNRILADRHQEKSDYQKQQAGFRNEALSGRRANLKELRRKILQSDRSQPSPASTANLSQDSAARKNPRTSKTPALTSLNAEISRLDPQVSEAEIEVSNGNGVYNMAHQVGRFLEKRSFPVTRITNARHFQFGKSTIFYCQGYIKSAFALAKQIPGDQGIEAVESLGRPNIKLRLLLGRDLADRLAFFKQLKLKGSQFTVHGSRLRKEKEFKEVPS